MNVRRRIDTNQYCGDGYDVYRADPITQAEIEPRRNEDVGEEVNAVEGGIPWRKSLFPAAISANSVDWCTALDSSESREA